MDADDLFRRLRGASGNAVVWGAGWFALGLVAYTVLRLAGVIPEGSSWLDAPFVAARLGVMGGIAGGAFSAVIGVLYRGRRLAEIGWVRFGIGAGVVTGVFVPAFLQTMNLLSGDGFVPMGLVLDDALLGTVFGGLTAGGSLRLAQRVDALPPGEIRDAGRLEGVDPLASVGERDLRRRSAPARPVAAD